LPHDGFYAWNIPFRIELQRPKHSCRFLVRLFLVKFAKVSEFPCRTLSIDDWKANPGSSGMITYSLWLPCSFHITFLSLSTAGGLQLTTGFASKAESNSSRR
jgi:hypothetical protein